MKELSLCQSWLAKLDRFLGESRRETWLLRQGLIFPDQHSVLVHGGIDGQHVLP
jgi:hypothetical protein